MQDASVVQFRRILTANDKAEKRAAAEQAGDELGHVLVLKGLEVEQLTPQDIEKYRRRYCVEREFCKVMVRTAAETRRAALRWNQESATMVERHA